MDRGSRYLGVRRRSMSERRTNEISLDLTEGYVMKKLIAIAMFTMFAAASGVSLGSTQSASPSTAAVTDTTETSTDTTPAPNVYDPVCSPAYVQCTAECGDLSGSSKAACLRVCRAEYNECLAH